MLTAGRLRELLHYDPETGSWRRIVAYGYRNSHQPGPIKCNKDKGGRFFIRLLGHLYLASRLAWLYQTGEWPLLLVDHKDGDPSNNKWENLREATHAQNMRNGKIRKSASGYKGVYKRGSSYRAKIIVDRKQICLGTYASAKEAADAYNKASIKYHGEFGRLN